MSRQQGRNRRPTPEAGWRAAIARRWLGLNPRARVVLGAAAALAVIAPAVFIAVDDNPQPRARQYLAYSACLLTTAGGVTSGASATAWTGMQEASLKTRARVQFLAISGPETVANARPFLNTLVQTQCNIVIAAEDLPRKAVLESAAQFPKTRFIVIGPAGQSPNVTGIVTPDESVPGTLKDLISNDVERST